MAQKTHLWRERIGGLIRNCRRARESEASAASQFPTWGGHLWLTAGPAFYFMHFCVGAVGVARWRTVPGDRSGQAPQLPFPNDSCSQRMHTDVLAGGHWFRPVGGWRCGTSECPLQATVPSHDQMQAAPHTFDSPRTPKYDWASPVEERTLQPVPSLLALFPAPAPGETPPCSKRSPGSQLISGIASLEPMRWRWEERESD